MTNKSRNKLAATQEYPGNIMQPGNPIMVKHYLIEGMTEDA